jgi:mannose-6-phosphate isomerase-like protein (cupin superfamily)
MRCVRQVRALGLAMAAVFSTSGVALSQGRPIRPGQPITTPPPATPTDFTRAQTRLSTGLQWIPLDVPDFPPGASVAIVHGDPNVRNRDYVIRLRFPAGYRFPVQWHEESEHITVLQGTLLFAIGDEFDESLLQRYGPGDFVFVPAQAAHFGGARLLTVIQVHGTGPFRMNLGAVPIR